MVNELVHHGASLKQMAYNLRCGEVVVHRLITFCCQRCSQAVSVGIAFCCHLHPVEVGKTVHQTLQTLLACHEGVVGEVDGAAIVGRENEEANGHGRVGLRERLVCAFEELLERYEVAKALAHLLSVDGEHVVVHPVVDHLVALRCHSLCDLTLVVREDEVHASAVYVEMGTQIFASHGRALAVPSRETVAPGTWPAHDMLGLCLLPQGEVGLVVLLSHAVELARCVFHVVEVASRENAVMIFLVIFLYVKIDRAVAHISKSVVEDLLHELLLLNDVACGVRLDAWRQNVEGLHGCVIAVGVILRYLHWLKLLQACLLLDLVVAVVCIVLQVSHIGDVAHIAHLVADMLEITEQNVEGDGRTCVSEMWIAVDSGAAYIHAHVWSMQRLEQLLLSGERIVDNQWL